VSSTRRGSIPFHPGLSLLRLDRFVPRAGGCADTAFGADALHRGKVFLADQCASQTSRHPDVMRLATLGLTDRDGVIRIRAIASNVTAATPISSPPNASEPVASVSQPWP